MVPKNAVEAFNLAEDKLRAGAFEDALTHYLMVVRAVPDHWRSRFRIADTLLNLNAAHHAFEIYKALAWHAIKAGHPLWGLVAIKMAAAMDQSQGELVHIVADLYSRDSPRIDRSLAKAPRRTLRKTDPVGEVGFATGERLIAEAAQAAATTDGMGAYPQKLPAIPLFSYLSTDAFGRVLEGLQLKRFVKDQNVITEGEQGASFFILAEGDVAVTRKTGARVLNLARLSYGAVFGEMALIKDAPRTATVTALNDCDLLELSRGFLEKQGTSLVSVTQALNDFTHERFLANLTATSAIFKPFPRSIRSEIIKRFVQMKADPGEVIIREGDDGKGLYLVLKGQVDVLKWSEGTEKNLATLKEGDVMGEISLLQASPTTASCRAKTKCELLFLERKVFNSLMARHPELKAELSKITADRIQKTKEALNPEADDFMLIEDDDVIML